MPKPFGWNRLTSSRISPLDTFIATQPSIMAIAVVPTTSLLPLSHAKGLRATKANSSPAANPQRSRGKLAIASGGTMRAKSLPKWLTAPAPVPSR